METQLVRLDAPYNLICNKDAEFGLHIATLIVINPFDDKESGMSYMYCYPVVERENELGGEIWKDYELETCKVICRHSESISFRSLKTAMEYYYGWSYLPSDYFVWDLKKALVTYGSKIILPNTSISHDPNCVQDIISNCNVELIFDNDTDAEVCIISSSFNSYFFFLGSIDYNPGSRAHPGDDEETAIIKMAVLRDAYLIAFDKEGLKSISFYTKNKDYQDFVEKINSYSDDNTIMYIISYLNERCGNVFNQEVFSHVDDINEEFREEYEKKMRELLSKYLSNTLEVGRVNIRMEEIDNKQPKQIFQENLDVDKIRNVLAKFNRNGCGPKQFCKIAMDFFAGIGWLPIQIDTYFVSWMKYNSIVSMKGEGLTHVSIDDEKICSIKQQLKELFQFKNDRGVWEDRTEFYLPNRKKVNNGS